MKCKYLYIIILGVSCLLGLAKADYGYAAINLSINSSDGGDSLYFGRVDSPSAINKEVRIRVTSTEGKQYQVFQRLNTPLTSERGDILARDVIVASSLIDSNMSGTLYMQDGQQLTSADQIIYTSSEGGESDSFTIVYQVEKDQLNAEGNFSGEVLYTVRNVFDGSQDQGILNIFLEASTNFDYSFNCSTGLDTLSLNSSKTTQKGEYFSFTFDNNYGNLKVYQEIVSPLVNEKGEEMDLDLVLFNTSGGDNGELNYQEGAHINQKRILLYQSKEQSDDFFVTFHLDPNMIKSHKAGFYTGKVRFTLELDAKEKVIDYNVEVEIEPYFKIALEYPKEGMAFTRVLPNAEAQTKEVTVTVDSNIGRPYVVTQKVNVGGLSNQRGDQIEKEYFQITEELIDKGSGKVASPEFVPVEEGESHIFYSDKIGSPAKFRVYYRLTPYATIKAGDYTAAIVYSLEEI